MRTIGLSLLVLCIGTGPLLAESESFLPTPYTAEQIREASRASIETLSKTTTPEGVTYSLDRISVKSPGMASFHAQKVDESSSAQGEPVTGEASWEALRKHALFATDRATRVRETRKTAIGELEGWLYTVRREDASISKFFFADRYPGPPVVYSQEKDGELLLHVEMIEKRQIP